VTDTEELPLFPLQAVLFPGGLLGLKVFETRYVDLIAACLRTGTGFGVVMLNSGSEVGGGRAVAFEPVGTRAAVLDVDSAQPGILQVRCAGTQRFRVEASRQQPDGLWIAKVTPVEDDPVVAPAPAMLPAVRALATTIATLKAQGESPFRSPYHFEDAGWVANRWCEILPLPRAAKQKLMELPDAGVRLQLVDEFLRSKGLLS
jgi:Lon protease-like protein